MSAATDDTVTLTLRIVSPDGARVIDQTRQELNGLAQASQQAAASQASAANAATAAYHNELAELVRVRRETEQAVGVARQQEAVARADAAAQRQLAAELQRQSAEQRAAADGARAQAAQANAQAAAARSARAEIAQQAAQQREATRAASDAGAAQAGFGASLRGLLGPLATAVAGFLSLKAAVDVVKTGFEFNAELESMELGVASIVSAFHDITDSQGRQLQGTEKLAASQAAVADVMAQLKKDAIDTTATLPQLVAAFQAVVGPASAAGLSLDQSRQVTVAMVQTMGALGIEMGQARQEIASILNGAINTDSRLANTLGITNEMVRQWKEQGKLGEGLLKTLDAFVVAGKKAGETWQGVTSTLKDNATSLMGVATSSAFDELKGHMTELNNSAFGPEAQQKAKEWGYILRDGMALLIDGALLVTKKLLDGAELVRRAYVGIAQEAANIGADAGIKGSRRESFESMTRALVPEPFLKQYQTLARNRDPEEVIKRIRAMEGQAIPGTRRPDFERIPIGLADELQKYVERLDQFGIEEKARVADRFAYEDKAKADLDAYRRRTVGGGNTLTGRGGGAGGTSGDKGAKSAADQMRQARANVLQELNDSLALAGLSGVERERAQAQQAHQERLRQAKITTTELSKLSQEEREILTKSRTQLWHDLHAIDVREADQAAKGFKSAGERQAKEFLDGLKGDSKAFNADAIQEQIDSIVGSGPLTPQMEAAVAALRDAHKDASAEMWDFYIDRALDAYGEQADAAKDAADAAVKDQERVLQSTQQAAMTAAQRVANILARAIRGGGSSADDLEAGLGLMSSLAAGGGNPMLAGGLEVAGTLLSATAERQEDAAERLVSAAEKQLTAAEAFLANARSEALKEPASRLSTARDRLQTAKDHVESWKDPDFGPLAKLPFFNLAIGLATGPSRNAANDELTLATKEFETAETNFKAAELQWAAAEQQQEAARQAAEMRKDITASIEDKQFETEMMGLDPEEARRRRAERQSEKWVDSIIEGVGRRRAKDNGMDWETAGGLQQVFGLAESFAREGKDYSAYAGAAFTQGLAPITPDDWNLIVDAITTGNNNLAAALAGLKGDDKRLTPGTTPQNPAYVHLVNPQDLAAYIPSGYLLGGGTSTTSRGATPGGTRRINIGRRARSGAATG